MIQITFFKFVKKSALYLSLLIIVVVAIFPLFWIFLSSLKMPNDIFAPERMLTFSPTLTNYARLFEFGTFPSDLLNSVIISLVSISIAMVIGVFAGYALSRFRFKHEKSFLFFALTTRMGPAVVFALPFYLLYKDFGLIDTYLGMFIIYTFFNLAFAVWMSKIFFDEVPKQFEESAMVCGCSRLDAFRRITLPLASRGLIVAALLCFIFTWNEFFYAMVLTRSAARTFTVSLLQFVGAPRIRWELLFAASTIAVSIPIIIAVILRKYLIRGLTFGLVKGKE